MAGIADVARLAGVSKATASRAMSGVGYVSEATRQRVVAAAAELGYAPSTSAVSLATGRTRTVGVIMPLINRWFFAEVLEGIHTALRDAGLDLTLYDAAPGSPGRATIFTDFLARKRFDGLIAVGLEPGDHESEQLARLNRPMVTVVGAPGPSSVIELDDLDTARRATEHLIALGHTHIAFVGGAEPGRRMRVDGRRIEGYQRAMTDAGLAEHITVVASAVSMPGGYAAAADVLASSGTRPTAIDGLCDEVAIGAIIAARRLGIRVPSQLSVIGIDDHENAEMFSLTTLRQSPRDQGAQAVRMLRDRLADPNLDLVHIELPAQLVVRSSTGHLDPRRSPVVSDTGLVD